MHQTFKMIRLILLSAVVAVAVGANVRMDPIVVGPRIVGGKPIDIRTAKYQLSFRKVISATRFAHFCGASIISPNVCLTAAHCTRGKDPILDNLAVVAGTTSLIQMPHQQSFVKQIIEHKSYDPVTTNYDIALLILQTNFRFDDRVQPIALTRVDAKQDTLLRVSGWGALYEDGESPTDLMAVDVYVFPQNECNTDYNNRITDKMFCAGKRKGLEDSCQGDSGGPLVDQKTMVQFGVVSWGVGCARPNKPGVYTQISKFTEWIGNYMAMYSA